MSLSNTVIDDEEMYVVKRNNTREIVSFNKILQRIKKIGNEINIKINCNNYENDLIMIPHPSKEMSP